MVNNLKNHFRTFNYMADSEVKHWLEMRDPNAKCNMITIG